MEERVESEVMYCVSYVEKSPKTFLLMWEALLYFFTVCSVGVTYKFQVV